jgi:hypothetical protein
MKGKTQERMERGSRKRSSSDGSEMERVGDRQGKMEGHCSTGRSPQRAVVPMEEEELLLSYHIVKLFIRHTFFHGWTALMGLGLLLIEVLRLHSDTAHLVGLLWMSDQPILENSDSIQQWQDLNPESQQASSCRPVP